MTLEIDSKVQKRSVTAGDTEMLSSLSGPAGPVLFLGAYSTTGERAGMLPIDPPMYGSRECDAVLRSTPLLEAMWSNVIFKVTTRIASFGWNITDADFSTRKVVKASNLLHTTEMGSGWVTFISKVVKDFMCTNNGAFIEIIRASGAAGSKVIGLRHLDSLRCFRTGDPERPVVYYDMMGHYHIMRDYQVISLVDMPSSDPSLRGIGICAAMRAYNPIVKLQYLQRYIAEKVAGTRPQTIYFVNNVRAEQIKAGVSIAEEDMTEEGYVAFMGAVIVPTYRPEAPQIASIDLAGLPDKADPETERRDAYLHMAHSAGLFVGEIQPLEGQYGTGTQSVVLSEAAQGQGMASLVTQLEHKLSYQALPASTSFMFQNVNDWRDQKAKADVAKTRAETRKIQIENGELDQAQAKQTAADFGDINRLFLEQDGTPDDSMNDDEKQPTTDALPEEFDNSLAVAAIDEQSALAQQETTKQLDRLSTLFLEATVKGRTVSLDEIKAILPSAQVVTNQPIGDLKVRARQYIQGTTEAARQLYLKVASGD